MRKRRLVYCMRLSLHGGGSYCIVNLGGSCLQGSRGFLPRRREGRIIKKIFCLSLVLCPVTLGFFFFSSKLPCYSRILFLRNVLFSRVLVLRNVLFIQNSGPPKFPVILGFWSPKMSYCSRILVLQNVLLFQDSGPPKCPILGF